MTLLLLAALAADPLVAKAEAERIATVARIKHSVAAIFTPDGSGGGSGVVVSPDGFALTNYHVSGDGPALRVGLDDGRIYDAVVVGADPVGDVAVIKLLGRTDFPAAPFGDSDKLQIGDSVLALGNPFLLATDFEPTVTFGVVSGVRRYQAPADTLLEYADCIQTDAAINPGNSGGPLFDLQGRVVGINGRISIEKRGRVNVGVGYAISIDQIKHFYEALRGGLLVDHATLGAVVTTDETGQVVVDQIVNTSDAYRLGLRSDDRIVSFGGRPIGSVNQFKNVLGIYPAGWRVPLLFRRGDELKEIRPRLAGVHRPGELEKKLGQMRPPEPPPRPGKAPNRPPPAPNAVASMFDKRPGFTNYWFNRTRRDELLKALPPVQVGRWRMRGKVGDRPTVVTVADNVVGFEVGEKRHAWIVADPPADDPPGTNGLLVALSEWRRLFAERLQPGQNLHFAGSAPDVGGRLSSVVISERKHAVCRWHFDPATKRLTGVECQTVPDAGPCEISFADERDSPIGVIPHRWTVTTDGAPALTFVVEKVEPAP